MKQLSLLMFTILVLGCGNQKPVSEPDEEIAELKAIADQLSQAVASLDRSGPTIAASNVAAGDTDVDPEPLNRDGIHITFSERISLSHFNLHDADSTSIDWRMEWSADGQTVTLTPPHLCAVLRPDTTYTIDFVVQDFSTWKTEDFITFSTKPQWSADQQTVTLRPPNTCSMLMNDKTYVIDMNVSDYSCSESEISISFTTAQ